MATAMIWGAEGGMGRALVQQLQAEGWTVLAVSRGAAEVAGDAIVLEADLGRPHEVQQAALVAGQEVDVVDLWVYAAGDITSAVVAELRPDAWKRLLDANLTGAFLATHYSLPLLAPDAHLFFLGARSERMRLPGLSAYAAAKAGLEAFAETLAKEHRKRRVTVVRPGAVDTDFWQKVPFKKPPDSLAPQQVAEAILAAYRAGHKGQLDLG